MAKLIDLTGQRFGKLTVVERVQNVPTWTGEIKWLCHCDCGNTCIFSGNGLKRKTRQRKSCGCERNESGLILANKKLYKKWIRIKVRTNPENKSCLDSYIKNGITVCDEWKSDFKAFYDWSMANGYSNDLTLTRIDSRGNFSPENCRWADSETWNNNKSNTVFITYNDETLSVAQWARKLNIDKSLILKRLKCGYTIEQALAQPRKYNKNQTR